MPNRPIRALTLFIFAAVLSTGMRAQSTGAAKPDADRGIDKAAAYYHAALGHLYAELAGAYGGRGEFLSKAIDSYKAAMKADPTSAYLAESLADLYLQSGQIRSAVTEFEEAVRRNPDDVNSRRILGRFYTARIREGQQARVNEDMLRRALEQYKKISEKVPQDVENWLMLGRLYKASQNSAEAEKAFKKALELDKENEDAMAGLAMVYTDLGDTAGASQMLKRVAEKNPNLRTLTALAGTYEQMREYKLAAETYKRALDLNTGNTDLRRAYAQALFAAEDYEKAKTEFETILGEDASDLLSNLRLSQIYRQKKDFARAREFAKKARELDPNNLEIRYNEISLLEAEGKTHDAINTLKEVLAGMPKRPDSASERSNRVILLERLGYLYRSVEQTPQAVQAFREIGELDPDVGGRAAAQIIDVLRAGKNFAEAEKEAEAAMKKFPSDRTVKVMYANVLADSRKFNEAVGVLKSLFDGKSDRETHLAIAQIHEKAKNYKEMAAAIDEAEKLSKTNEEKEGIFFIRGAMYERSKRHDLAEAEFRKALAIDANNPAALNYLGYMLADRNVRLNEALEMIKKAVDADPHNSAYLDSLGWVYFRLGRLDEAEEYLKRSLERSSKDPTVHDHLGDVYAAQGKLKDAVEQYEISLREWNANAPSDIDTVETAKVQKKLDQTKVRVARGEGGDKVKKN